MTETDRPSSPAQETSQDPARPRAILVVDDHDLVRMGVCALLQANTSAMPIEVLEAGDLAEAMAVYEANEDAIELVLLDLALPDTQGDAYRDRLLGLLDDLDLRAAVRLTDYLAECDVSALLFAADAVALPFTYGVSFKSGSLLAALVHMRAVVATTPKVEDPWLECGRHLLCVAPRDEHSLADALLRVLREPALRCELGAAGAEAARPFDWRTIADEHLTLYDRLLDRR